MKLTHLLPALCLTATAAAQTTPEGAELPRNLTPAEAASLARSPILAPKAVTPPPAGPVHCVAEYEPMAAIVMAYEGSSSWKNILAEMAAFITTTGNADVVMVLDTASEQSTAQSNLQSFGANLARVQFEVIPTDSIWLRDYGPRYIYQGGVRAIVDHEYNRPRPADNALNSKLGPAIGHRVYELPLVHGGGNYHLSALGDSYSTRLIANENPGLSEPQIIQTWKDYQSVDTTLTSPFPTSVDSTQHIDMWMQIIADRQVVISDWPFNVGSFQDQVCDGAAATMAAAGYTVTRVPARSIGGTHYTYTNMVMCNDLLLLPRYTNASMLAHNTEALNAIQAALPGKTIQQINCQSIVTSAGVMHCIVQHMPVNQNGALPGAFVISLNGGESLSPGSTFAVDYATDDDAGVTNVTLEYSSNAGASWSQLASGLAPFGSYLWSVPTQTTTQALLRVTAFDGAGNSTSDVTDATFTIGGGSGTAGQNLPYGVGKPGLSGVPVLSSSTPPNIGQPWTADVTNALASSPGWLAFGFSPASIPFDGGTLLLNYTQLYGIATDGGGAASWSTTIPANPGILGLSVFWQVAIPNDPGAAGSGYALTNGLEVLVGQ
ncbi:MAG: agmatine deiminase family protein [Planctomycetota bacterium]|nr:agmatine deiminase family protein [Planctomycetota bacterium]